MTFDSPAIIVIALYALGATLFLSCASLALRFHAWSSIKKDYRPLVVAGIILEVGAALFLSLFIFEYAWIIAVLALLITLYALRHFGKEHVSSKRVTYGSFLMLLILILIPTGMYAATNYSQLATTRILEKETSDAKEALYKPATEATSILKSLEDNTELKQALDSSSYTAAHRIMQRSLISENPAFVGILNEKGSILTPSLTLTGEEITLAASVSLLSDGEHLIRSQQGIPLLLSAHVLPSKSTLIAGFYFNQDYLLSTRPSVSGIAISDERGVITSASLSATVQSLLSSRDLSQHVKNIRSSGDFSTLTLRENENLYQLGALPLPTVNTEDPFFLVTITEQDGSVLDFAKKGRTL
jgi:hypothetical protein